MPSCGSTRFLAQIFDNGNTAIEKRAIVYKRFLPLMEFGREREGIDLSKIVLTRHKLKNLGKRPMPLHERETPKLDPTTELGSGMAQEKQSVYNVRADSKTERPVRRRHDRAGSVGLCEPGIRGKLLESETLRQQADNSTKEPFATSTDLDAEPINAIVDALDAHTSKSTQALNSDAVRRGIKDILFN